MEEITDHSSVQIVPENGPYLSGNSISDWKKAHDSVLSFLESEERRIFQTSYSKYEIKDRLSNLFNSYTACQKQTNELEEIGQLLVDLEAKVGIHDHPGTLPDRLNELFHTYWGTGEANLNNLIQQLWEMVARLDEEKGTRRQDNSDVVFQLSWHFQRDRELLQKQEEQFKSWCQSFIVQLTAIHRIAQMATDSNHWSHTEKNAFLEGISKLVDQEVMQIHREQPWKLNSEGIPF